MDPNASDSSQQKTSPNSDPAALMRLFTELTAQSSQLAMHQHQLNRLTTLTEELVKALQGLSMSPSEAASLQPPNRSSSPPSQTPPISPRLAFPEKFDGEPARCKGFLLQCSLFVSQQPSLYPTDSSRIAFVCSLLTGKALAWVTAVWKMDGSSFPTFDAFLQHFRNVFEHPANGRSAGDQLLILSQGRKPAAEYALLFRTLAAQTIWVEDTLKLLFRRGLNLELQSELACRDEGRNLNEFIDLAIQVDNLIRSHRSTRATPRYVPETMTAAEPMQLGFTHLTPEERERRMQNQLCLYCGQSGHMKTSCPVCPSSSSRPVSVNPHITTSTSSIKVSVEVFIQDKRILKLTPCNSPLAVEALDGRPLGEGRILRITEEVKLQIETLHSEFIRLYVIQSPSHSIILGLPWLRTHNPHIS